MPRVMPGHGELDDSLLRTRAVTKIAAAICFLLIVFCASGGGEDDDLDVGYRGNIADQLNPVPIRQPHIEDQYRRS